MGLLVLAFAAGALVACSGDQGGSHGSEQSSAADATATGADTAGGETAAPSIEQASSIDTSADDLERASAIPLVDADGLDGWGATDDGLLAELADACTAASVGDGVGIRATGPHYEDTDGAALTTVAVVLASIADAPRTFDDLNGPDFRACLLEGIPGLLEAQGLQLSALSASPFDAGSVGERSGGTRYSVAVRSNDGSDAPSLAYDTYWVLNGREIAGILVGGADGSPPASIRDRLFRKLASKIGASRNDSPAAGTGTTDATTQPAESESESPATVDAAELEGVVRAWYEDADPAVCDRMTNAMLDFGWGKTGAPGRRECQANLDEAEPAEEVTVNTAKLDERRATVEVSYEITDGRNVDRVTFVRRDGAWLIDRVRLIGFE